MTKIKNRAEYGELRVTVWKSMVQYSAMIRSPYEETHKEIAGLNENFWNFDF